RGSRAPLRTLPLPGTRSPRARRGPFPAEPARVDGVPGGTPEPGARRAAQLELESFAADHGSSCGGYLGSAVAQPKPCRSAKAVPWRPLRMVLSRHHQAGQPEVVLDERVRAGSQDRPPPRTVSLSRFFGPKWAGALLGQGDRRGHDPRIWPSARNALLALADDQGQRGRVG